MTTFPFTDSSFFYTPVPGPSGSWTYTYTGVPTLETPIKDAEPEHATVKDIPGWRRCPPTAATLTDFDGQVGWTALTDGSDKAVAMDSDGFLYLWKGAVLRPVRGTVHEAWGVQVSSYQGTKEAPIQIAAYIPKQASQCLRIIGVDSWLPVKSQYLPISKVLGKPLV